MKPRGSRCRVSLLITVTPGLVHHFRKRPKRWERALWLGHLRRLPPLPGEETKETFQRPGKAFFSLSIFRSGRKSQSADRDIRHEQREETSRVRVMEIERRFSKAGWGGQRCYEFHLDPLFSFVVVCCLFSLAWLIEDLGEDEEQR